MGGRARKGEVCRFIQGGRREWRRIGFKEGDEGGNLSSFEGGGGEGEPFLGIEIVPLPPPKKYGIGRWPSCTVQGKLKHNLILVFRQTPEQHLTLQET